MLGLVTKELQIKSTMWYHFTSIRLAWIRTEDIGRPVECHPWKVIRQDSIKLIVCISYNQ